MTWSVCCERRSSSFTISSNEILEALTEPLTIHHLLTHTSGFTYGFNGDVLGAAYDEHKIGFGPRSGGLQAGVERLAAMPLAFQPGGMRLVLMSVQRQFDHGQHFDLALAFERAGTMEIEILIEEVEHDDREDDDPSS